MEKSDIDVAFLRRWGRSVLVVIRPSEPEQGASGVYDGQAATLLHVAADSFRVGTEGHSVLGHDVLEEVGHLDAVAVHVDGVLVMKLHPGAGVPAKVLGSEGALVRRRPGSIASHATVAELIDKVVEPSDKAVGHLLGVFSVLELLLGFLLVFLLQPRSRICRFVSLLALELGMMGHEGRTRGMRRRVR